MSALFQLFFPPPDLASCVQAVWVARGRSEHRREVVLPNGVVEIIFNLSDPQWVLQSELHPKRRYDGVFLAGAQRGPLLIEDEAETDLLGVRFHAGGVTPWLRTPLGELTDRVEDTADLDAMRWANALHEQLGACRTDRKRLNLVFTTLRRQRTGPALDSRVRRTLQSLLRETDPPSVAGIAKRLGITHKHLDTLFYRAVGFSPRTLHRVMRFHDVVSWLRRRQSPVSWANLALRAGFADQAHMIREFRAFSGTTPSSFLRLRTDDGWHLKGPTG